MGIEAGRSEGTSSRATFAQIVVKIIAHGRLARTLCDRQLSQRILRDDIGFKHMADVRAHAQSLSADVPAYCVLKLIEVFPTTLRNILRNTQNWERRKISAVEYILKLKIVILC